MQFGVNLVLQANVKFNQNWPTSHAHALLFLHFLRDLWSLTLKKKEPETEWEQFKWFHSSQL